MFRRLKKKKDRVVYGMIRYIFNSPRNAWKSSVCPTTLIWSWSSEITRVSSTFASTARQRTYTYAFADGKVRTAGPLFRRASRWTSADPQWLNQNRGLPVFNRGASSRFYPPRRDNRDLGTRAQLNNGALWEPKSAAMDARWSPRGVRAWRSIFQGGAVPTLAPLNTVFRFYRFQGIGNAVFWPSSANLRHSRKFVKSQRNIGSIFKWGKLHRQILDLQIDNWDLLEIDRPLERNEDG